MIYFTDSMYTFCFILAIFVSKEGITISISCFQDIKGDNCVRRYIHTR